MAEVFHRDTDEFDILLGDVKEDNVGFSLYFDIKQEEKTIDDSKVNALDNE